MVILIENSKEKKIGQVFTERILPIGSNNQKPSMTRKEIFPWLQETDTLQSSTGSKHADELFSEKTIQSINSIRTELSEYRYKLEILASENNPQNKMVALLRSELTEYKYNLAEYKSKLESILSKNSSQVDIDLLKSELANYKSKLDLVASERDHREEIESIKLDLEKYKSKVNAMVNEITVFLEVVNSLNEEISRFKNNLGSMTAKQDNGFVMDANK